MRIVRIIHVDGQRERGAWPRDFPLFVSARNQIIAETLRERARAPASVGQVRLSLAATSLHTEMHTAFE